MVMPWEKDWDATPEAGAAPATEGGAVMPWNKDWGAAPAAATATPASAAPEGWGPWLLDQAADIGGAAAAGIGRGAAGLIGLPGTLGDFGRDAMDTAMAASDWALGYGWKKTDQKPSPFSGAGLTAGLSTVTGGASDYKGDSTAAQFAGAVGEALPGAALAPGGATLGNLLLYGALPGAAGEAAARGAEMAGGGDTIQSAARFGAGVLSPILAQRVISPFSREMSAAGADPQVQALRREGVEPTAGQMLDVSRPAGAGGNSTLRSWEAQYGGGNLEAKQSDAFRRAVGRRIGTDDFSPGSLRRAARDLGSDVADTAARATSTPTTGQLSQDLDDVVARYGTRGGATPELKASVQAYADDIRRAPQIDGPFYQEWRSEISARIRGEGHTATKNALIAVRDRVDKAVADASGANWADDFRAVRQDFANYKTVEDAMGRAGQAAAGGELTPAALRGALGRSLGRAGQAQGRGDMSALANAGASVLAAVPNSGTAGRMIPALAGNPLGALGIVGGRVLSTPLAQSYLKNTAAPPVLTGPLAAGGAARDPAARRRKRKKKPAE